MKHGIQAVSANSGVAQSTIFRWLADPESTISYVAAEKITKAFRKGMKWAH